MYAKIFTSIYQGTLRGDTHGLVVFTNLLAHADADGWVDIHPRAIAEEVGLSVDQVKVAISALEAPDPESRSPEEEGRRIVRLDDHRDWGWRIVNHAKYRSIRNEEERREQNRLSQQRWREKNKPPVSTDKHDKPIQKQIQKQIQEKQKLYVEPDGSDDAVDVFEDKPKPTHVPYKQIISLYHETLPMLPKVYKLTDARKGYISARWHEDLKNLDEWRNFFGFVARSDFLTGRAAAAKKGDRVFKADLEWITRPGNFAKIAEDKYHG